MRSTHWIFVALGLFIAAGCNERDGVVTEAEVDEAVALYKRRGDEATMLAAVKELGPSALPHLKNAFEHALETRRAVDAVYAKFKKSGESGDVAELSTMAGQYLDAMGRMTAIYTAIADIEPEGCAAADELYADVKSTCSDARPPGDSSQCTKELSGLRKAHRACGRG